MNHAYFDDLVVGSSPLLLLQALRLAEGGSHVCIVDKERSFGGAWRTTTLSDDSRIEIACHLIEAFPGVYEHLEKVSGIQFVELDEQPVRATGRGWVLPYFSRTMLALSGLRLLTVSLLLKTRRFLGLPYDVNEYINFTTKLSFLTRFQLGYMIRPPVMKGPSGGYVALLESLIRQCREKGCELRQYDVATLRRHDGGWVLEDGSDTQVHGDRVHMTTSASLSKSGKIYVGESVEQQVRTTIVIAVLKEDVIRAHSYVAFWKDPFVARISRLDGTQADVMSFLVEARSSHIDEHLLKEVAKRCHMCGIVHDPSAVQVVDLVSCDYMPHRDQLPLGEIEKGLFTYYSNGNLAAGIAGWLGVEST